MSITETAKHSFGHGQTWFFQRTSTALLAGKALASLPEVDSFEISLTTEKVSRKSKRDAVGSTGLSVVSMVSGTWKLVCSQHVADLIALYLFGTKSAIAGGSVTAEPFPTGIVAGEIRQIPNQRTNISTWTSIVDSAGSPITLVDGTDYEKDADAGVVKFINVPGTQPYKLTGVEAPSTGVGLLQSRTQEVWIRHKEINLLNSDAVEPVDLYRCQVDPASSWTLLNDGNDPNKYEIGGEILKDTLVASSATFGQYGRWRQPN